MAMLEREASCHYRRTRRGAVLKVVEESYLRSDLGCGAWKGNTLTVKDMAVLAGAGAGTGAGAGAKGKGKGAAAAADASAAGSAGRWLLPDTNVVLHQMDLLEYRGCAALDNLIITETVLDEVGR